MNTLHDIARLAQQSAAEAVRGVKTRVQNMILRAAVTAIDNSLKTQRINVAYFENNTDGDIEHLQPYGFYSVPLEGAEALLLALAGNKGHSVAICVHDKDRRPKDGAPGDAGIFDSRGNRVKLTENGTTIESSLTRIGGDDSDKAVLLDSFAATLELVLKGLSVQAPAGAAGGPCIVTWAPEELDPAVMIWGWEPTWSDADKSTKLTTE